MKRFKNTSETKLVQVPTPELSLRESERLMCPMKMIMKAGVRVQPIRS